MKKKIQLYISEDIVQAVRWSWSWKQCYSTYLYLLWKDIGILGVYLDPLILNIAFKTMIKHKLLTYFIVLNIELFVQAG